MNIMDLFDLWLSHGPDFDAHMIAHIMEWTDAEGVPMDEGQATQAHEIFIHWLMDNQVSHCSQ